MQNHLQIPSINQIMEIGWIHKCALRILHCLCMERVCKPLKAFWRIIRDFLIWEPFARLHFTGLTASLASVIPFPLEKNGSFRKSQYQNIWKVQCFLALGPFVAKFWLIMKKKELLSTVFSHGSTFQSHQLQGAQAPLHFTYSPLY